jgi:hypothetical protein
MAVETERREHSDQLTVRSIQREAQGDTRHRLTISLLGAPNSPLPVALFLEKGREFMSTARMRNNAL